MATPPISDAERKRRKTVIEDCYREGYAPLGVSGGKGSAIGEAARRLKLNSATLGTWIGREVSFRPDDTLFRPAETEVLPKKPEPPPEERRELQRLRDKCSRLEAALREADRAEVTERDIREKILGLAGHTPEPPSWLIRVAGSSGVTGVPSTIWSDWHCNELVDPAQVNGVNEFNLKICEDRIRRLVERILDLCYRHMTAPQYPGIVINLIGDLISGELHPELAETDELDLFPAILWATDRLIWALSRMAEHFGQVFVACAPGNHGRVLDKKPRAKGYVYRNADWLIFNLLERRFQAIGEKRIQFSIPATGEVLYRVYHHRYMAVHGDDLGVKGGDGIIGALGPIMRGEIRMRHSSAQIGRDYDTLLMGHWHQTLWLPRAFVNNTLKGLDEYARRMLRAPATRPAQSLWFTHPKHGVTAKWEVLLDDRPMDTSQDWLSMTKAAA